MTLSAVGEQTKILQHDWYNELTREQLAAYIRYQFIYLHDNAVDWDSPTHSRLRRVWDGGKNHDGRNYSSTWHEVVRLIARISGPHDLAHPGMWVHAHFSPAADAKLNAAFGLPEITPRTLHSARSPSIYNKYLQIGPQILAHKAALAEHTLQLRLKAVECFPWTTADRFAYALCDETYVTATPFFRCAFASRANCDTALEMYLWEAAINYEANQPLYDFVAQETNNTWWRTDALTAAVAEIRDHWRNYCGE